MPTKTEKENTKKIETIQKSEAISEVDSQVQEDVKDQDIGVEEYSDKDYFNLLLSQHRGEYKEAMFEYCFHKNLFFSEQVFDSLVRTNDDSDYRKLPELYEEGIKANSLYKKITFFEQLKMDNFERVYSTEINSIELPEESKKDRQQIISIIGYDPFEENLIEDRPQLYRDLTGMLTDGMRKDIPKAKAAVEVVTGYNNIRKYQGRANSLINKPYLDEDEQKQLDKALEMITKIQASLNSINDKNGFSNNKSIGNAGRGMLSDVMKTIDEHTYDPGYVNYYDIATSESIQKIADISNKSIMNQVKLSGQDFADMLAEQAEIVHKAQKTVREAQEAARIAKEMLKRQELIERLGAEYRTKGIDEKDIQEFLDREYRMWEK